MYMYMYMYMYVYIYIYIYIGEKHGDPSGGASIDEIGPPKPQLGQTSYKLCAGQLSKSVRPSGCAHAAAR